MTADCFLKRKNWYKVLFCFLKWKTSSDTLLSKDPKEKSKNELFWPEVLGKKKKHFGFFLTWSQHLHGTNKKGNNQTVATWKRLMPLSLCLHVGNRGVLLSLYLGPPRVIFLPKHFLKPRLQLEVSILLSLNLLFMLNNKLLT